MTNAQKPNKNRRNKTNKASTRKGSRAKRSLNHGKGKGNFIKGNKKLRA